MKIEKCKYYNDAQTACSLMIDDLVPIALCTKNKLKPNVDWGGGMGNSNSLYSYFYQSFLSLFPEIRGTFFLPFSEHIVNNSNGYSFYNPNFDDFVKYYLGVGNFELAFHGTYHTRLDILHGKANYKYEFASVQMEELEYYKGIISDFERKYNIHLQGGKYPGYIRNEAADLMIEKLGFLWWSNDQRLMINKKSEHNKHYYWGIDQQVLLLPVNLNGRSLCMKLLQSDKKYVYNRLKQILQREKIVNYISYLVDNGLILTIQEHFQNLRFDGKIQHPNVYTDVFSLIDIFKLLRGCDIYYGTNSEIAHYLESYDYTSIYVENEYVKITYNGRWGRPFLSLKSDVSALRDMKGNIYEGKYKNGMWIFNELMDGEYKACQCSV